jgi:tRNA nucleotidyltransferase (CCA-adding enzyme)
MKIQVPETVVSIIEELENHGYPAFLVGGYVRDQILHSEENPQKTEDFDIATSATPKEIKEIFREDKIFAYGEKHGTLTLRRSGVNYEITTFREEEGYSDGRRPDKVTFIRDLTTDLARRDFTVNAFALEKDGTIIDYFGGLDDIENKVIRAVGDPVKRLQEDSLRIFRAIRFAVRLGFNIDEDTKNAIKENRHLILEHQLSGERIFFELNRIIKNLPRGVMLLHELDLLPILFANYTGDESIDWLFELLKNRKYQDNQPTSDRVNWAIFLHYIFENTSSSELVSDVKEIFVRYPGLGNANIDFISHLLLYVRSLYNIVNLNDKVVQSVVVSICETLNIHTDPKEFFHEVIKLLRILDDRWGGANIDNLQKSILEFLPSMEIKLPIDGNDLVSIGYNGSTIGTLLELVKSIFLQDTNQDKFHLLDYINTLDRERSHFVMENYLKQYELKPNELLDEFVKEALLAKMKDEYRMHSYHNDAVVVEINTHHILYIEAFLKGFGKKNVIVNSLDELDTDMEKYLQELGVKHIGFKYSKQKSIEALNGLSLTDPLTIIFNVK